MKTEISSGGVIFKKTGKIFNILLILDKKNKWTFPKGLVEKGEDNVSAAKREISEEVGLKKIKLVDGLPTAHYIYTWRRNIVKKTVYYYLFNFTGEEKPIPQTEEGIKEAKWFTVDETLEIIGYPQTNKPILEEAIKKHGME